MSGARITITIDEISALLTIALIAADTPDDALRKQLSAAVHKIIEAHGNDAA